MVPVDTIIKAEDEASPKKSDDGDKKEESKEEIEATNTTATNDDGKKDEAAPTADKDQEQEDEKEHGRVGDPVEHPARNAPKKYSESGASPFLSRLPVDSSSILSRLFDPDRKQKPQLWTHIRLVAPGHADQPPPGHLKWRSKDAIAAYCLKCKKQFTYTRGTSKTISRHMQAYHGLGLDTNASSSSLSPALRTAGVKRSADGMSSPPPLKKRKPDLDTSSEVKLLQWIVGSFRPMSIVKDKGLAGFLQSLSGSFVIPSTENLIRVAIDTQEKVKLEIRRLLKDCDTYSVSIQGFKSQDGGQYCSIRVTFCTSTFNRHACTLAVVPGPLDATIVQGILEDFSLSTDKLTNTTQQGIVAGTATDWNMGATNACVLETLNTLVVDEVSKGLMGELFTELRSYIQYHYGWIKVGGVLAKLPQDFGTDLTGVKDAYLMLQKCNTPVEKECVPGECQVSMIKCLTAILKPFYDATTTLSDEQYPTIGLAIPVFRRIRDVLEKLDVKEHVDGNDKAASIMKNFHHALSKSFCSSFGSILGDDAPSMWTMPLDPRLVHMGGLLDTEKESVTKMLIEKVKECKIAATQDGDTTMATAKGGDKKTDKKGEESTMGGIFWGHDAEEDDGPGSSNVEAATSFARASVDRYFTTVRSHRRIDDPLSWWSANQSQFPELSQLARTWLGASAVGAPADGRTNYPKDNVQLICFLHDNFNLIENGTIAMTSV